jgi:hypothetical protein
MAFGKICVITVVNVITEAVLECIIKHLENYEIKKLQNPSSGPVENMVTFYRPKKKMGNLLRLYL